MQNTILFAFIHWAQHIHPFRIHNTHTHTHEHSQMCIPTAICALYNESDPTVLNENMSMWSSFHFAVHSL